MQLHFAFLDVRPVHQRLQSGHSDIRNRQLQLQGDCGRAIAPATKHRFYRRPLAHITQIRYVHDPRVRFTLGQYSTKSCRMSR